MFSKSLIAISTVIAVTAGSVAASSAQSRTATPSASTLALEQVMLNRARGTLSSADLHAKAMGSQPEAAELAFAQKRKTKRSANRSPSSARASGVVAAPTKWPHDELFTDPVKRRAAEH